MAAGSGEAGATAEGGSRARTRTSSRGYVAVLAALAGGGALALVAAQAVWVRATGAGDGFQTPFTGAELATGQVACALVAMAGAVAVIATRGVGRRLVAVVLTVVGVVLVVGPVRVLAEPAGAARHPLALVTGGAQGLPRSVALAWWWPLLAVVGGVSVVTGAVLTVLRGGGWPVMAARFESPARAGSRALAPGDAWARLDRGEDPTVDQVLPSGPSRTRDGAERIGPDPGTQTGATPGPDPGATGAPPDLQE